MTSTGRPALGGRRALLVLLGLAALVIAADQLTKAIVIATLGPEGPRSVVPVIPGLLRFIYVQNTGVAFGMFQDGGQILIFLAMGVILLLAIAFRQLIRESIWLAIALGLQFGGALGNIIDRLRHGFVVDFIDFPRFPTFNVADCAITVGVIILGFFLLRRDMAMHAPETVAPAPAESVSPGNEDDKAESIRHPSR